MSVVRAVLAAALLAGCPARSGYGALFVVTVEQAPAQLDPATSTPILFSVAFGRAVSAEQVRAAVVVQTGTAPDVVWGWERVSPSNWLLTATPSGPGTLAPILPEGAIEIGGERSLASESVDNVVTYLVSCARGAECDAGYECVADRCVGVTGVGCAVNDECAQVCIASMCQAPATIGGACDELADCATGHVCVDQVCLGEVGASCTSNDLCVDVCIGTRCDAISGTNEPCDELDDCASGHTCLESRCVSNGDLGFVSVVAGSVHACALSAGGVAYCWGHNAHGQLGVDTPSDTTQVPLRVDTAPVPEALPFVSITAGYNHTCALNAAGVAYCWGRAVEGQLGRGAVEFSFTTSPARVLLAEPMVQISGGVAHTCGLTSAGVVYCWGEDLQGQLGNGEGISSSPVPVPIDVSTIAGNRAFTELASGYYHTCGITADGAAHCWGSDTAGALGNDTGGSSQTPGLVAAPVPLARITAGRYLTCALTAEHVPWCWGNDEVGQVGDGNGVAAATQTPSPVMVDALPGNRALVQLSAGFNHGCGLAADGALYCWGEDAEGQLGNGGVAVAVDRPAAIDATGLARDVFVQVAAGDSFSCAITSQRRLHCWGDDARGQLGDGGASVDAQAPTVVDVTALPGERAFVQIATGGAHACGISARGELHCWGSDGFGQLGNGATGLPKAVPVAIDTSTITGNAEVVAVSAGLRHTCALTAERVAYCWGADESGQLGNGGGSNAESPARVDTLGLQNPAIVRLTAGWAHTCAVDASGAAHCWGSDTYGTLGDGGSSQGAQAPVAVDVSGVATARGVLELAAGGEHTTCARMVDGVVYCWGRDLDGQVGDGANGTNVFQSPRAVDVSTITGNRAFVQLSGGALHNCGRTADGAVHCWGANGNGRLGDGGTTTRESPTRLATFSVELNAGLIAVAAGEDHTCALSGAGAAYCWGGNQFGQLGEGGVALTRTSPEPVAAGALGTDRAMRTVSSGGFFTCALTGRGVGYCWGTGTSGQLGNGSTSTITQPVPSAVVRSGL